jgi:KipI family sensor histidine kinase inhibitor
MAWQALGDSAWLFKAAGETPDIRLARVLELHRRLLARRIAEVSDFVSSFDTLAVHFDPADGPKVADWIQSHDPPIRDRLDIAGKRVEVPVAYGGSDGPDLDHLATTLGMEPSEIVRLHCEPLYRVAAVGFSPGFPYLLGLPEALRVPRINAPRPVAAGAVAIAGGQAGIYPFASQGGWHVLGRTSLELFNPFSGAPTLLKPGDCVRFVPINAEERVPPNAHHQGFPGPNRSLEVLDPGAITTVQDLGRPGFQSIGVSPGGALDPVAARCANRLLGNPDHFAVLECTMRGPLMVARHATRVAWLGGPHPHEGRPLALKPGDTLDLRKSLRSVRGYLAVAGGFDVPQLLGSRATDLRAGFGGMQGRTLRPGDLLPTGPPRPGPKPGAWSIALPRRQPPGPPIEIRILRGGHSVGFAPEAWQTLLEKPYQVSPVSDRTGMRLHGPELQSKTTATAGMVSQPVVAGTIQVPPNGQPIILMAERQTIGGYPQIAHVISADLPKLARAWPGTLLRFREVSLPQAQAAWIALQHELALLQTGLGFHYE